MRFGGARTRVVDIGSCAGRVGGPVSSRSSRSLVARLRVTRAASVVAAMVLGLAIAWPFAARAGQLVEMVSIAAQANEIPWHYSLWAVPLGFFAVVGSAVLWRGLGSWMTHSDTYATDLGPAAFRGSGSLIWTGALLAMRTTWRTFVILVGFSADRHHFSTVSKSWMEGRRLFSLS